MTSTDLVFARDLSLPRDAATQKFAFLGRSSSGKSYAAKRLVESLVRAGTQVVIFDSVGIWYGLRSGQRPLDIPILGGLHGDVALDHSMGAAVANLACDHATSLVLDVSQMTDADRTRFTTAFAHRFYERMKAAPRVITLVLEECQEYIPQEPQGGEAMMLHELQRIAKVGRNFGIGLVLISQRPQEINKKALNQTEVVVAFQMTGPQERKALTYWLSDRGVETGLPLEKTLPLLEVGRPFVWSPQWLKVSRVVEVLPIETGDTSRTPTVGAAAVPAPKLSVIDIQSLLGEMQAAQQESQESDPKFLRARIAELEKALKKNAPAPSLPAPAPFDSKRFARLVKQAKELQSARGKRVFDLVDKASGLADVARELVELCKHTAAELGDEKLPLELAEFLESPMPQGAAAAAVDRPASPGDPVALGTGESAVLESVRRAHGGATQALIVLETKLRKASVYAYLKRLRVRGLVERSGDRWLATAGGFRQETTPVPIPPPASAPRSATPKVISERTTLDSIAQSLPPGEAAVLLAIFQHGERGATFTVLSVMTGYATRSITNYVSALTGRGLISREGHLLFVTDAGKAHVPPKAKPYPTGKKLVTHLIATLPAGESATLGHILSAHPNPVSHATITAETQYAPRSVTNYISTLLTRRVIERVGREVKIHHEVMP